MNDTEHPMWSEYARARSLWEAEADPSSVYFASFPEWLSNMQKLGYTKAES